MDAELKRKWVEALRSGRYNQGMGLLRNYYDNSYCCLGVLCEVMNYKRTKSGYIDGRGRDIIISISPQETGLTEHQIGTCMGLNDDGRHTFLDIAEYIEREI